MKNKKSVVFTLSALILAAVMLTLTACSSLQNSEEYTAMFDEIKEVSEIDGGKVFGFTVEQRTTPKDTENWDSHASALLFDGKSFLQKTTHTYNGDDGKEKKDSTYAYSIKDGDLYKDYSWSGKAEEKWVDLGTTKDTAYFNGLIDRNLAFYDTLRSLYDRLEQNHKKSVYILLSDDINEIFTDIPQLASLDCKKLTVYHRYFSADLMELKATFEGTVTVNGTELDAELILRFDRMTSASEFLPQL